MPEIEAKLHAEIDRVLGGRLPTHADVPKLIYARAIFEEVLRLYPPIPLLTREAVREEVFGDCPIPKGSLIVVCPWLLHRNPVLWHNPDHFVPERFMLGGYRPPSKFAYIPFSVGPRACIGMAFGITEAILCIATIAQTFRLRLKPGHRVEVACRLTIRPGERLPMQLIATDSQIQWKQQLILSSGLLDRAFYLAQCPGLTATGIDPIYHYLQYGPAEGRDPNPLFDTDWYLHQYPDVQAIGENPLIHYLLHGSADGYDPNPLFDTDWYLRQNPDVQAAGKNPLAHFLLYGAWEGRDPSPLFDTDWYLERYPDVQASGTNPLVHYLQHGAAEGRDPNPLFDSDWYLRQYLDVHSAGENPLVHYVMRGAAEGRDPSPLFDTSRYLEQHPDVRANGVNPLAHHVRRGAVPLHPEGAAAREEM
jgi:hypothetical protein